MEAQASLFKDLGTIKIYKFKNTYTNKDFYFASNGKSNTMEPHGAFKVILHETGSTYIYNKEGLPEKEILHQFVATPIYDTDEVNKTIAELTVKTAQTLKPDSYIWRYYSYRKLTSSFKDETIQGKKKYKLSNYIITPDNTIFIELYDNTVYKNMLSESKANIKALAKDTISADDIPASTKAGIKANTKDVGAEMANGNDTSTGSASESFGQTFSNVLAEENSTETNIYSGQTSGSSVSQLATNVSNQVATGLAQSNIMGAVGSTVNVAGSAMSAIATAQELAPICINKITNEVTTYLTNKVTSLLAFDLSKITKISAQAILTYTMNAAAIISELTQSQESIINGAADAAMSELTTNITGGITKEINSLTGGINDKLAKYIDKVNTVTSYISKGQDWLVENMNLICDNAIEECKKEIGKKCKPIEDKKQEMYKNLGNTTGSKTAKITNSKLMAQLKVQLDSVKEAKEQAKTLAKTLVKTVILKLKGMLGG